MLMMWCVGLYMSMPVFALSGTSSRTSSSNKSSWTLNVVGGPPHSQTVLVKLDLKRSGTESGSDSGVFGLAGP